MDHPESQTAGVLQTLKSFLTDPDELINILPSLEISFIYILIIFLTEVGAFSGSSKHQSQRLNCMALLGDLALAGCCGRIIFVPDDVVATQWDKHSIPEGFV